MTNEYKAGKLSILKCDHCQDGYLIVKPAKQKGYLLGCTNYKKNGTGCNNIINKKPFYEMMGYALDSVFSTKENTIVKSIPQSEPESERAAAY